MVLIVCAVKIFEEFISDLFICKFINLFLTRSKLYHVGMEEFF